MTTRAERERAAARLLGSQVGAAPRLLQRLVSERIQHIPLHDIQRNPEQPRKTFSPGSIDELATSILSVGLRQPVEVDQPEPDADVYVLTYGERRLRAFELLAQRPAAAGFDPTRFARIPALVRTVDATARGAVAIVENLHRQALTPGEMAEGLVALKGVVGTWEAVASAVGLDVGRVKRLASLAGNEVLVQALERGDITQNQAFSLRSLKDPALLSAAVIAVGGSDDTTTRRVVRELLADDASAAAADRVTTAMAHAVGTADASPPTRECGGGAPTPRREGSPSPPKLVADSDMVVPAQTPLRDVMRQRRVSRERFLRALQLTCEQTGIWPTPPGD